MVVFIILFPISNQNTFFKKIPMNDEQMKTVVDAILDKGLTIEEMLDVCVENNASVDNANTLIETMLTMMSDGRV